MSARYVVPTLDGQVRLGTFRDVRADWESSVWALDSHETLSPGTFPNQTETGEQS